MSSLDRAGSVELIEERYFGSVARADIDGVADCFTPSATVIIRHGDLPHRHFGVNPTGDEADLLEFYRHICGEYECWFGKFQHYIDVDQQRAASRFEVRLTPKPGGAYSDWPVQTLTNCNFFDFAGDRIEHMIIYYSNPGASGNPTGYPPEQS